ncbi:hypothetical protein TSAR_006689 [Trichomalopsis sarcophagae]|uniref:Uncharacterized protein n=1 Tax=Trichomalopsis sarcophagae TaxID=543379 RepID=A0A232FG06_9HYME|nr:hypothetical protein TSAR_006689 [Trichomalopsis sarcophagae]
MELYACIRFVEENLYSAKYYYVPITSVYCNKRDTDHIVPVDLDDYDTKKKYYIFWNDGVNEDKYPGYISKEDAKNRALIREKRVIIPKKLTSSDTSDQEIEENNSKNPAKKRIDKMFAQNNSRRIMDTYKNQVLLRSRQELTLDNVGANNDARLEKDVTVQLTDFLKSNQTGTYEIDNTEQANKVLSDSTNIMQSIATQSKVQKARKTFQKPSVPITEADVSSTKENTQTESPLSPLNTGNINSSLFSQHEKMLYLRRLHRLRELSDSPNSSRRSESPHRSVSPQPLNLLETRFTIISTQEQQSLNRDGHHDTEENLESTTNGEIQTVEQLETGNLSTRQDNLGTRENNDHNEADSNDDDDDNIDEFNDEFTRYQEFDDGDKVHIIVHIL